MTKKKVLIRFNTENTGNLFWRVMVEGEEERLANEIVIWAPSHTSRDILPDGREKFHITTYSSSITWNGNNITIN